MKKITASERAKDTELGHSGFNEATKGFSTAFNPNGTASMDKPKAMGE